MNVLKSLLIDSILAVECMQKDFEENGLYSPELYDRLVGPMLAMDNEILANLDTSPVAAALDTIYGDLYAYLYKEYPSGTMDLAHVSDEFHVMLSMVA